MRLIQPVTHSLDDILLKPQYSDINSRLDVDLSTKASRNFNLEIPIMATNMSTITESKMMILMSELGGVGVLHRFMPIFEQTKEVRKATSGNYLDSIKNIPMVSVGVGDVEFERVQELYKHGVRHFLIDVAHAHSEQVSKQLEKIKTEYSNVDVIVGNIATQEASEFFLERGVDGIRVGIGGGSRCTTRTVTGHGVPNLHALIETVYARDKYQHQQKHDSYIPIILDGGIKNSGDIVKALYFGADVACIGNLLAGTDATPGEPERTAGGLFKKYYGMSSKDAGRVRDGITPEGFSASVPYKGSTRTVIEELVGGIRSGLTYSGARNIMELRRKGKAIYLSLAARMESKI